MKKYIVVTGGAGFIGANLIKLLINKFKINSIMYNLKNNKIISKIGR